MMKRRRSTLGAVFIAILCNPVYSATVSTFDVVLATGNMIVVGTSTINGNAFSVGNSTFVVSNSSVGIRTNSLAASLDVNGNAQFGVGATKSTFTAIGSLQLATGATMYSNGFRPLPGSGNGLVIQANDSTGSEMGGSVLINAGTNGPSGNFSGSVNLNGGSSTFGPGGDVNIIAGKGLNTGGQVVIQAGDETSNGSHLGGNVSIIAGNAAGAGDTPGNIYLNPGNNNVGTFGKVSIISNSGLSLSGSLGTITTQSSITAAAFFGDSAGLFGAVTLTSATLINNNPSQKYSLAVTTDPLRSVYHIYVSTSGRVGVGTNAPATQLDVNGTVQFGTGPSKSTFSATGFLTLSGSTLTASSSGIINAPSQPRASLNTPSGTQKPFVWAPVFWQTAAKNTQNIWKVATASQTITVPTGGGGWWSVHCVVQVPLEGVGNVADYITITSDGSTCSAQLIGQKKTLSTANVVTNLDTLYEGEVSDGATFTCCVYLSSTGNVSLDSNIYNSHFSAVKIW